ncbi:MAG: hypothetical protein ACHQHN_14545 [Sphingobacteriales bacterium]
MKTFLFSIAIACCLLACKKESVRPGLFGKWELRHVHGGDFVEVDTVYKPGNGNAYQFNSDSTYKKYVKGVLSSSGRFHIPKNNSPSENYIVVIVFDNDTSGEPFAMTGVELTLGTASSGGIESDYQKISN